MELNNYQVQKWLSGTIVTLSSLEELNDIVTTPAGQMPLQMLQLYYHFLLEEDIIGIQR